MYTQTGGQTHLYHILKIDVIKNLSLRIIDLGKENLYLSACARDMYAQRSWKLNVCVVHMQEGVYMSHVRESVVYRYSFNKQERMCMYTRDIQTHSCPCFGEHYAALAPVDALDVDGLTGTIERQRPLECF